MQRNRKRIGIALVVVFIGVFIAIFSHKRNSAEQINKDYTSYISAYTNGVIPIRSVIRVVFASDFAGTNVTGTVVEKGIISFSPSIKGEMIWVDTRTIEITPFNPLPQDQEYAATIELDKLVKNIAAGYEEFNFTFRTIKQSMEVALNGLEFYNEVSKVERRLSGVVATADFADASEVKKTVEASQNGNKLEMFWDSAPDGKTHRFWVENIRQGEIVSKVILNCNGDPINATYSKELEFEIPITGVFRVLTTKVVQNPDQFVEIRFSEPLDQSQNLQGLITCPGISNLKLVTDGNVIRVYPSSRQKGSYSLNVTEGIRSLGGQRLGQATILPVQFEVYKPELKMIGEGVIIPSSEGLLFPFQAVSLRAVDIEITRIYEDNIAQFLQINNLAGNRELRRVGRMILRKTILLNQGGDVDFGVWNTYYVDLSKLVSTEPGAIYQVRLSICKNYSAFGCEDKSNSEPVKTIEEYNNPNDDSPQNYYYDYEDYYNDGGYNWEQRDDPCSSSYYRNRSVVRNIIASNFGLIAKKGVDGSMLFFVTDLLTAKPISGVTLEVYNFQQKIIYTSTSDGDGIVKNDFNGKDKPFLLIAKQGSQRGYLKLDDGSSLSLSSFDISGEAVQRGIKGFIYGERGVWRPGDSIYISFILEDKNKTLPENHPTTFEFIDPKGQIVYRSVATTSIDGTYFFPTATSQDAPTGTYTARVKVGGATFTQPIRVETVMPNRLKLNLDFGVEELKVNQSIIANFKAKWLHGAPARSLKAKVDITLSQSSTSFKNYKDYTFDDPSRTFSSEEHTVFEGNLNENGETTFTPRIDVNASAPGVLRASFVARVFEEGGNFSIDRFSMPYYPFSTYVGVMLPDPGTRGSMFVTDTANIMKIVTVNVDGKPVSKSDLRVEVYKLDWRWWWEQESESLSDYVSSSYSHLIQKGYVSTGANGEGVYKLRINYPEWGRFLIRVVDSEGGHATGTVAYFDWPGWVKRDKGRKPEASSMLVFSSDKQEYKIDEKVNLTIPSSENGQILISIENGINVLETYWVESQKGETKFSFKITDKMTPNIYVHATLLQQHGQTANDLPLRMYGIIPIMVVNPDSHITPVIQMASEIEPEKNVNITLSEKEGKSMVVTLAMVDEGLLDLTRFKTPDPWNRFYAREALGVKTWDLFGMVMGADAGKMQRIISIGGDEGAKDKGARSANRFIPVVKYFGPFLVDKGKKKTVSFTMPNYVGSVRIMAVAAKEGSYGASEVTIPVRKPLMVLSTLPRVLGPEEEVILPVTVFAMDKSIKDVKIKVELNKMLIPIGETEKTITFNGIGDMVVKFNLKVASRLGVGKVKVTASSGKNSATHEIELNVRNPNTSMTVVKEAILSSKQNWSLTYKAFGMEGTNKSYLEFSTIPPINLGYRLQYLITYPHGCLEQTTSGAFPQLFISKLGDFDFETRKKAEENVRYGLDRIRSFRTPDGGLSLWPGGQSPDEWANTYAGHFMLEAEALGYSLPAGIMEGWKRYQRQKALSWSPSTEEYYNNDLMQAYRLYTLALAKIPELGAMNRLREYPKLTINARYRLAAAYALAGNPEAAKSLIQGKPIEIKNYRETGYTYGSYFRDKAMVAEALLLMNDLEKVVPILKDLSAQLSKDNWMSTQEISFSLLAFSKFAITSKSGDGIDVSLIVDGSENKRIQTKFTLTQNPFNPVQKGEGSVEVTNNSNGSVFARLITTGIPVAGNELPQSSNINMEVTYHLMNGTLIQPDKLVQGTDFYAAIAVQNPGTRSNFEQLSLSVIVPSGWEIRNSRMEEASGIETATYDYQDVRDDRVYTYFNLLWGKTKTFKIVFNAAYVGKYYLPSFACEAMYDNSIFARNSGKWVEVVNAE
jgi:uncharacterized protein YfaS (alpha-2-macroglobulin family)